MKLVVVAVLLAQSMTAYTPPGAPEIQIGSAGVVEGHAGSQAVDVLVLLSAPAPGPTTVTYATRDRTATTGADYVAASGTLTFAKGDVAATITVSVVGDRAIEGDETFEVVLSDPAAKIVNCPHTLPSKVILKGCAGSVTIADDDFPPRPPGPGGGPSAGLAIYEVRFTFTGHTGSLGGSPDCPVRRNGRAVLTGLVSGNERVAPDDDIEYRGTLFFHEDLDLCDTRRVGGEDRLCSIRVAASGPMNVELAVYEDDRGGYVKAEAAKGFWLAGLTGSCDPLLIAEERGIFPDGSAASVFNGEELPLRSGPLRVGRYPRVEIPPASHAQMLFEVLRKIQ